LGAYAALTHSVRSCHILEDPSVTEVLGFLGCVDAHAHHELAIAGAHRRVARQLARVERVGHTRDRVDLLAVQAQR